MIFTRWRNDASRGPGAPARTGSITIRAGKMIFRIRPQERLCWTRPRRTGNFTFIGFETREGLISAPTLRFKGDWSTLPGPRRPISGGLRLATIAVIDRAARPAIYFRYG